jgi:hypothetical protein
VGLQIRYVDFLRVRHVKVLVANVKLLSSDSQRRSTGLRMSILTRLVL